MHNDLKIIARDVAKIAEVSLQMQQANTMGIKAINERKRQQLVLNEIQPLKKLANIEVLDPGLKSDLGTMLTYNMSSSSELHEPSNALSNGLKEL